jgi:hypothetical protein
MRSADVLLERFDFSRLPPFRGAFYTRYSEVQFESPTISKLLQQQRSKVSFQISVAQISHFILISPRLLTYSSLWHPLPSFSFLSFPRENMLVSQSLPPQRPSIAHRRPSIFALFPESQVSSPCSTASKIESSNSAPEDSANSSTIRKVEARESQHRDMLRRRLAACGSYSTGQSHSGVLSNSVHSDTRVRVIRFQNPQFIISQTEQSTAAPSKIHDSPTISTPSNTSIQHSKSMFSPKNSPSISKSATSLPATKQTYLACPPSPMPQEWPTAAEFMHTTLDPLRPENWLVQSVPRKISELWFYGVGRNTPTFLSPESSIPSHSTRHRRGIRSQATASSTSTTPSVNSLSRRAANFNPRPSSPPPKPRTLRPLPLTPLILYIHDALSTLQQLPGLLLPAASTIPARLQLSARNCQSILLLPVSSLLRACDFWTPPQSATQWNTTMQRASTAWGAWWTDTTFNNGVQNVAQWFGGEICFGDCCCCGGCCAV